MPTDAQSLITEGSCYVCAGTSAGQAIELALLARIVGTGVGGTAYSVVANGGNNIGAGRTITITAQFINASGSSVRKAGNVVTWSKTGAGGSFSSPTSVTDANGLATVSFTVTVTGGVIYTFTATDSKGLTGTSSPITVIYDDKVNNWVARVVANGGASPSANTKDAVQAFYIGMLTDQLDALMIADLHVVPDNLIAARTPFYNTAGVDPWTNHGFVAGDLTVNGLVGDGLAKYLETGVNPTSVYSSDNDAGFSWYSGGLGSGNLTLRMAAVDTVSVPNRYAALDSKAGGGTDLEGGAYLAWTTAFTHTVASNVVSFCSTSRTASNAAALYQYNSGLGFQTRNTTAAAPGIRPNLQFYALAWNVNNGPLFFTTDRGSYFGMHHGMTSAQTNNYALRVQALRVALGGGFA